MSESSLAHRLIMGVMPQFVGGPNSEATVQGAVKLQSPKYRNPESNLHRPLTLHEVAIYIIRLWFN